jgi:hypothetical protein
MRYRIVSRKVRTDVPTDTQNDRLSTVMTIEWAFDDQSRRWLPLDDGQRAEGNVATSRWQVNVA